MEDKTILGSWCTEPYCKFIDNKHIQIELVAHIWYSYDNDSKTDVINKKFCFVKEIDFDDFNNIVEILEEEKKIPEKIKSNGKEFYCDNIDSWIDKEKTSAYCEYLMNKYNDLIDYLNSKGE